MGQTQSSTHLLKSNQGTSSVSSETKEKEEEFTDLYKSCFTNLQTIMSETKSNWEISNDEKVLLRESWKLIQSNIESTGVVLFLKLFETHPETLGAFIPKVNSLKEIEMNEWYSENLKSHSLRVMAVLEKIMHRLDDEERAVRILLAYGRSHWKRGVKCDMLEKMGESFVTAVQPNLESIWTKKMEEAWLALFSFITFFMKLAYPETLSVYVTS